MMQQKVFKERRFNLILLSVILCSAQLGDFRKIKRPQCGVQEIQPNLVERLGRIKDGDTTVPHSWPWMLSLGKILPGGVWMSKCGATILSSRWALTAGHCMYLNDKLINIRDYSVLVGAQDTKNLTGVQVIQPDRMVIPDKYIRPARDNDIALVHFKTDITMGRNAQPICLPDFNVEENSYVATGWGRTSVHGVRNYWLKQGILPAISSDVCNATYEGRITDTVFCAGSTVVDAQDTCKGDSGGPLMFLTKQNTWAQAGVVSWGRGCLQYGGGYGVYTRVYSYVSWIKKLMSA